MIFIILTVLLTAMDLITKILTLKFLSPVGSVKIIDRILSLTYVENRGAAFGILQHERWLFITLTIVIIAAVIFYVIKYKPKNKVLCTSLSLIISGALGNLFDRIFRGFVVDMIEITFIDYPVFNFADCCVVIGAVLFGIYVIFIYKEPKKEEKR